MRPKTARGVKSPRDVRRPSRNRASSVNGLRREHSWTPRKDKSPTPRYLEPQQQRNENQTQTAASGVRGGKDHHQHHQQPVSPPPSGILQIQPLSAPQSAPLIAPQNLQNAPLSAPYPGGGFPTPRH
eukprot:Trichotokara_eunicae@DN3758_c0_g1_i2.p1